MFDVFSGIFFWSHEVAVFSFRIQCVQTVQVMKKAAGPHSDFGAAIFWSTKFIQKIFQILRHPKNRRDFLIYPKQSQTPTAINHCFNCYHDRMALILELWDRDLRHLFPASCFACAWRIRWVGWWCHYFKELQKWKFHFPGMTWTFLPRLLFNYKINLFNAADYDLDEHEKLLRENLRHTVPGTEVIPRKNSWVNVFEFGIWNRKTSMSNIFVQNMLCEINGLQKNIFFFWIQSNM